MGLAILHFAGTLRVLIFAASRGSELLPKLPAGEHPAYAYSSHMLAFVISGGDL